MLHLFTDLEFHTCLTLIIILTFIFIYEVINGFHDTANAVAIIIYTKALNFQIAIIISGILNFLGVIMGGLSVAYTIVHLLPNSIFLHINSANGIIMIFSMLIAAIIWNIFTWKFGLPASSSHTLIGAIIGIGLIDSIINNNLISKTLNLSNIFEVFISLFISPIIGFILSGIVIVTLNFFYKNIKNFNKNKLILKKIEKKNNKPPFWTRILLISSGAGISFAHGANDGQKGIGLIMLVLIGIAPSIFIVNINASSDDIYRTRKAVDNLHQYYLQNVDLIKNFIDLNEKENLISEIKNINDAFILKKSLILEKANYNNFDIKEKYLVKNKKIQIYQCFFYKIMLSMDYLSSILKNLKNYNSISLDQRFQIKYLLTFINNLTNNIANMKEISISDKKLLLNFSKDLIYTIEYAPIWIIISIALSLSLGTMIGWRRVTKTIGKKIGKKSITYVQGISTQITASLSIFAASYSGMPVSTTHVVSSAIVGSMVFDGSSVQIKTIKSILLAWILTLPLVILLSSTICLLLLQLT